MFLLGKWNTILYLFSEISNANNRCVSVCVGVCVCVCVMCVHRKSTQRAPKESVRNEAKWHTIPRLLLQNYFHCNCRAAVNWFWLFALSFIKDEKYSERHMLLEFEPSIQEIFPQCVVWMCHWVCVCVGLCAPSIRCCYDVEGDVVKVQWKPYLFRM